MSRWGMVKLANICNIQYGFAFDSNLFTVEQNGLPLIRIRDVLRGYSETYTTQDCPNQYIIFDGDLLVGMDGEFNIARWNGGKALLNQRVCKLAPKGQLNDTYLLYCMVNILKSIEDQTSYVTVKHLSAKELNKVQMHLPPLNEQKRIAKNLDLASEIVKGYKEQLAELDKLIQSVFYEMFGDPVTNEKGWNQATLKSICEKIGSGATPRGGKESYIDRGIALVRSMNVYDGFFKYRELAFIDGLQAKQLDNVELKENDVLINITGASVARSCIVPNNVLPARVNQHVSILRCKKKLEPAFLNRLLIYPSTKQTLLRIGTSNGATREAITKLQLEQFTVLLPPLPLQTRFAEIVTAIEAQKAQVQAALEQAQNLFNSLMQEYFE